MKIVKPSVKLIEQKDIYDHIAYCAKVCYATETVKNSKEFVEKLIQRGHKSMLRHGTVYLVATKGGPLHMRYELNPYSFVKKDRDKVYITTNLQVLEDNDWYSDLQFIDRDLYKNQVAFDNMRYSFEVVTQISTSRELNRTSPNNIAEQSTRYCNFSKGKFGNEITICEPHWFKSLNENQKEFAIRDFKWHEHNYLRRIEAGWKPQDAREFLPLATATKCIYTYTIDEWRHILNLRYYGITGTPHPNAKIIAGMIRDELIKVGYLFR